MIDCSEHNQSPCVSKVPIFNHLTKCEMQEISKTAYNKKYKKNEIIFHQDELNEDLYIVNEGRLKVSRNQTTGKEQLIRFLHPGDFLGELSIFSKSKSKLEYEVVATEETQICVLNKQDMRRFLLKYPEILIKFLEEVSERLEDVERMLGSLSSETVGTRLARYLLERKRQANCNLFSLGMKKHELASYLGTSPETISRRLTSFIELNLLETVDDKQFIILNEALLLEQ